jgi:uncharacterized protein (DUF58 family)
MGLITLSVMATFGLHHLGISRRLKGMMTSASPLLSADFLSKLEQLELIARRLLLGRFKGDRLSKRKGTSVEFADHRHYVVGDDFRFLDWNLFARLDKLFIRLFQEEEDLQINVLIDLSKSMDFGTPTKLHYAKQIAGALAYIGLVNMDRVQLGGLSNRFIGGPRGLRGRKNMPRLLEFLDSLEPAGRGDLAAATKAFCVQAGSRGIAVVLSDFLDKSGFEAPLRSLLARQMEVYAIQILAPEEMDPTLQGDLKLVDVEDDDQAEITVTPVLIKKYRQTLAAYQAALKNFCQQRGIQFLSTSTVEPFDKLVLSHLRTRGLVK